MAAVFVETDEALGGAMAQDFEVRALPAAVGAEVLGLDLSRPIVTTDFTRLHQAHLQHHVLVFRDQRITPQQQIDFRGSPRFQCNK